ncbi:MAG: serpin family protein [Clostridia bacterium]|jgi:serine protease inhibitor
MKKPFIFLLIFLLAFSVPLSGCSVSEAVVKAEKQNEVVIGNTRFAIELFKILNKDDSDKNIFISPISISTALTMTLNGASGSTKEAMEKALFYTGISLDEINSGSKYIYQNLKSKDNQTELIMDNSIWIKKGYPIKQSFKDVNKEMFDAYITDLDFSKPGAADEINNRIKKSTKGMIDQMIRPPIPEHVVMYLINAIYFKGDWTNSFDPKNTYEANFYGKSKTVTVDMMRRTGDTEYYGNERLKAVRLPYGQKEAYAMYVILPDEESDIDEFIDSFDADTWNEIRTGMVEKNKFNLMLPKFNMEYGIKELKAALTELGMGEAFTGGADFSLMSDGNLYIENVLHKAVIEVNEEGSKAAGATVVIIEETYIPDNNFIANRPFLFIIADEGDGNILFTGKMIDG